MIAIRCKNRRRDFLVFFFVMQAAAIRSFAFKFPNVHDNLPPPPSSSHHRRPSASVAFSTRNDNSDADDFKHYLPYSRPSYVYGSANKARIRRTFAPPHHDTLIVLLENEKCADNRTGGAASSEEYYDFDDIANTTLSEEIDDEARPNRVKLPPSSCVWAIVACCAPQSSHFRLGCYHYLGCSVPFWNSDPCQLSVVLWATKEALEYYASFEPPSSTTRIPSPATTDKTTSQRPSTTTTTTTTTSKKPSSATSERPSSTTSQPPSTSTIDLT